MFYIKRNADKIIQTFLKFYSVRTRTHYDTLNLRCNCSEKEIKDAFITLSKEFHPDKNKEEKAQEQFVKIVEAYNVLSKPGSRAQYDTMLNIESRSTGSSSTYVYRTHVPYNLRNNPQYNYYQSYDHSYAGTTSKSEKPKDGIFSKKIPNYVIIVACAGVALMGALLQIFVIRNLYIAQRKRAQEKSMRLAEELDKVRAAAHGNGNELQTRILLDKIVSAANPTVATASLGQSLAQEKNDTSETLMAEWMTGIKLANDEWSSTNDFGGTVNKFVKDVIM